MQPWNRWQDWGNLALDAWLSIAPWIWHGTAAMTAAATADGWNAWVPSTPAVAFPKWINWIADIWMVIAS